MGSFVIWSLNLREIDVSILEVEFQLLLGILLFISSFEGFIGDNTFQIELTTDLVSKNSKYIIRPGLVQNNRLTWLARCG